MATIAVFVGVWVVAFRIQRSRSTTSSAAYTAGIPEVPTDTSGPNGLPRALYARPTSGGLVIDETTAGRVIAAAWALRLRTLLAGDQTTLRKFETGVQLETDLYSCGCDPPAGTTFDTWSASATRQTSYPASFLGQVTTRVEGVPVVEMMTFTRASTTQPWKVATVVGFQPTRQFPALLGPPSEAALERSAVDLPMSRTDVGVLESDWVSYWTHWELKGDEDPTNPVGSGRAVRAIGRRIVANEKDAKGGNANLVIAYRDDSGSEPAIFPVGAPDGSALVCGGTSYMATYTPDRPDGAITQTSGASSALDSAAPGRYRRAVYTGSRSWCVQMTPQRVAITSVGSTGSRLVGIDPAAP